MGVYISGISMPVGCGAITVKIWADDQIEIIDQNGEWSTTEAIPVPSHGRLVDAQWIRDKVIEKWMDNADDSFMYKRGMEDAYEVVRNAPTIIQADDKMFRLNCNENII